MTDGKPETEYAGIAADFARLKEQNEEEESRGLRSNAPDAKRLNKQRNVEFNSKLVVLLAFFLLIL